MHFLLKIPVVFLFFNLNTANGLSSDSEIDPITIQSLSKKWQLEKYSYDAYSEKPAKKEKNDYLHFKPDMTFDSVSEGKKETGLWRIESQTKRIYLSQPGKDSELIFIIDHISSKQLVLMLDDPSDPDAKFLKIHYTQK